MFGALRQGSVIYILEKQNALALKIGRVETTTQPTGYNMIPYGQQTFGQTMDITVKYDDGTTDEFKQLQANGSVAMYGNVVVTETRELMLQEIESMERESKKVIDSIPYHENVLKSVGDMKVSLSPEYAKEVETDKRLHTLEQGLGSIQQDQKAILDMLSRLNAPSVTKSKQ